MTTDATDPSEDADLAALAAIVSGVEDVTEVSRHAQIREIRLLASAGRLAEHQARGAEQRVKARDMALRSIAAELAGVLRMSDRSIQTRIGDACELVDCYPETLDAWQDGRITRGHVRAVVDAGTAVPLDQRRAFEAAAIVICERDTPHRVRHDLDMLAQRIHPRSFAERHRDAAAERQVRVLPDRDGMSDLIATLPTVLAHGIHDRLTREARAIIDARATVHSSGADAGGGRASGADVGGMASVGGTGSHGAAEHDFTDDTRGIDQVRADVFADTLLAGAPSIDPTSDASGGGLGAIRAHVQVVVPALTLLGCDDGPAELAGASPIDAATARVLAGCARSLTRILTHPVTGTVLEVDRYRPTSAMRRLLRGRDQHCRFPGCRVPAIRCEHDHTIDYALGGKTACCNLACLCQRHHSMKQFTPWRVRQLSGGVLEWTSPLGRTYREDAPTPVVFFAPAEPAAHSHPPAPF